METCSNPLPASEAHTLHEGDRKIRVDVTVDWGTSDLRDSWTGDRVFCSFACLAAWATEKAGQHDQHTLTEGV